MKLTRYTVDGKGIFRALLKMFNEVNMSATDEQDLFDAVEIFERDMEVPDICHDGITKTASWFTENGVKAFAEALDTISYYAELYLHKQIKVEFIEYDGVPLYKDYYQAVLPA